MRTWIILAAVFCFIAGTAAIIVNKNGNKESTSKYCYETIEHIKAMGEPGLSIDWVEPYRKAADTDIKRIISDKKVTNFECDEVGVIYQRIYKERKELELQELKNKAIY